MIQISDKIHNTINFRISYIKSIDEIKLWIYYTFLYDNIDSLIWNSMIDLTRNLEFSNRKLCFLIYHIFFQDRFFKI